MISTVIVSSVLIIAVLLLRLVFGKVLSGRFLYAMWFIPALCLILLPLFPDNIEFWTWVFRTLYRKIDNAIIELLRLSGISLSDSRILSYYPISRLLWGLELLRFRGSIKYIWLSGIFLMLLYHGIMAILSYFNLIRQSHKIENDAFPNFKIYETSKVRSPKLFGVTVFLPQGITGNKMEYWYSLVHESMHFEQGDFLWNYLRILLVSVYWFHPLVWVAIFVSKKDSEFSCDENVIKNLSFEERLEYGKVILEFATGLSFERMEKIQESNLAGNDVTERIKRIVSPKKQNRWHRYFLMVSIVGIFFLVLFFSLHIKRKWIEFQTKAQYTFYEYSE